MTRPAGRQLSLLLLIEGDAPKAANLPAAFTEGELTAAFAEWYAAYPRKKHPDHALKAFTRVLSKGRATIAELTEGRDRYVEECRRKGTSQQYIMHPATFLNGGCWQDERDGPAPLSRTASAFARVATALRDAP